MFAKEIINLWSTKMTELYEIGAEQTAVASKFDPLPHIQPAAEHVRQQLKLIDNKIFRLYGYAIEKF